MLDSELNNKTDNEINNESNNKIIKKEIDDFSNSNNL